MSAIGDYVHLTKSNYDKYGIQRGDKSITNNHVISQQASVWSQLHAQQKQYFANMWQKKDPVEEQLKQEMRSYRDFLEGIEQGLNEDYTKEKGNLLREILGDMYEELKDHIRINFATGEVTSLGGGSNITLADPITSSVMHNLASASDTKGTQMKDAISLKNKYGVKMKSFFNNSIKKAEAYFNKMYSSGKVSNADAKQQSFIKLKEEINKMIESMPQDYYKFKTGQGYNKQTIQSDAEVRAVANKMVELYNLLKVPTLSNIRGKVGEYCLQHFAKQGAGIGISAASDAIGDALTAGGFTNVKFFGPSEQELRKLLQENSVHNLKVENGSFGDIVTNATLSYSSQSQRKADVRLNVTAQENGQDIRHPNFGISVKNYTSNTLHLVGGSPLLNFLINGLSIDQINHYLNLFAEVTQSGDSVFLSSLTSAKTVASNAIRLMILYAAASGRLVGKTDDNIADYLLLTTPDKKNELPFVVNIGKLIGYIADQDIKYNVATNSSLSEDLSTISFPNKIIQGDNPMDAAGKRIAHMILALHQTKIYVAIPRQSIMTASRIKLTP